MKPVTYTFSNSATQFYFDSSISKLSSIVDKKNSILLTDSNVYAAHERKFSGWKKIIIPAGEVHKNQHTVNNIIEQLISLQADRKTTLVGIGGGVVTDIAGYAASIYMRGIPFGFVPTSILAMVDASIGGKNGIDIGVYKNMVGIIRQPSFILHDLNLLKTLPQQEWINGFAEIIKHACIKDAAMFKQLEAASLELYQKKKPMLASLIKRNAVIKIKVVQQDEFEKGDRRLLNFGHTLGHAIETSYNLPHGFAISIGMAYACNISSSFTAFKHGIRVKQVLEKYHLPTHISFDKEQTFSVLTMDKKRAMDSLNYIVLQRIGKGVVQPIPLTVLKKLVNELV